MNIVDRNLADALRQEGGGYGAGRSGLPATPPSPPKPQPRKVREGDILLGHASNGDQIGAGLGKLLEGRLLIQGNSGAGKSHLLRRIFEQTFGRAQQLLIDPDGEFSTLAEKFDVAVVMAADVLRIGGRAFGAHLRQHRYSTILDLSDATSEDRANVVADLMTALIEAPAELWHPMFVLIDETQSLVPRYDPGDVEPETRKRCIRAMADVMSRGRKRGISGIIATSRIAETSTPIISKPTNVIVGRTIFDRDLERAGDVLGFTAGHSRALRSLADGEFVGIGPAFNVPGRSRFKAGSVESRHKGDAPQLQAPPAIDAKSAIALLSQVEASEPQRPACALAPAGPSGKRRGRDWLPEEDKIIRDGYRDGVPIARIGTALAELGFSTSTANISNRAHALGLVSLKAAVGWSDREDEIIRDAYKGEVKIADIVEQLTAEGFSRGRVAVQMRAITLGITRDRVNYWTAPETKIAIAGLEAGKTNREIIELLRKAGFHRGVTSIYKFAQKHNFDRSASSWSEKETKLLQKLYPTNMPVREIADRLGKTKSAVAAMASNLNLRRRQPWTDDDKALLRKLHGEGRRLIDIPKLMPGRTYATIARMAGQMRLIFTQGRPAKELQTGRRPSKTAAKGKRK